MFGKKENNLVLKVNGMSCRHCEMNVEKTLREFSNITYAKADHANSKVEVKYSGNIDHNLLKEKITALGYNVL